MSAVFQVMLDGVRGLAVVWLGMPGWCEDQDAEGDAGEEGREAQAR